MQTHRFLALDSFRGLCALSVAIYHMSFAGTITDTAFFRGADRFVDFFFVLSGFVLAHAYIHRPNVACRDYMVTRAFRIAPLHLFMLGVFLLLELLSYIAFQHGINFRGEPFSGKSAPSEILPNLFLVHSWTSYTDKLSFNGPSWSISVEWFLYLLLFLTLSLVKSIRPFLWVVIVITAAYFCINEPPHIEPYLLRGLFSFFLGVLCYAIAKNNKLTVCNSVTASAIELGIIAFIIYSVSTTFEYQYLISGVIFAVAVVFFSLEQGIVSTLLKSRYLLLLGTLSYSIYMTHYFIIVMAKAGTTLASKFFNQTWIYATDHGKVIDFGIPSINHLALIILLVVIVYCSNLTYRFIERKGIAIGKRFKST